MTAVVTHTAVASGTNDPTKQVSVNAWNANHAITGVVDISQGGTGNSATPPVIGSIPRWDGSKYGYDSAFNYWALQLNVQNINCGYYLTPNNSASAPTPIHITSGSYTGLTGGSGGDVAMYGGAGVGATYYGGSAFFYGGANPTVGGLGGSVLFLPGECGVPGSINSGVVAFYSANGQTALAIQNDSTGLAAAIGFFNVANNVGVVALPSQPVANTALDVALATLGLRDGTNAPNGFNLSYTITATNGNVTINNASGQVRMAAAASTLTLTNSVITANSRIMLTFAANPGAAVSLWAVASAGSCTINTSAALAAATPINFLVIN